MGETIRLYLILELMLCLLCVDRLADATPFGDQIIKTAKSYLYVRELTNCNDGPMIDKWVRGLGLDNEAQLKSTGQGYSWCACYMYGMYTEVYKDHAKKNPLPRSARVSDIWKLAKKDKYRYKTFTAKQVQTGAVKLKAADVAIFSSHKRSDNFEGHTELVVAQTSSSGFTDIGGNVGASNKDSEQREQYGISLNQEHNGGVREKPRTVKKGSPAFLSQGFIRTNDQ
jgi:hypothetical protein